MPGQIAALREGLQQRGQAFVPQIISYQKEQGNSFGARQRLAHLGPPLGACGGWEVENIYAVGNDGNVLPAEILTRVG
jgi:hypothetical protein